MNGLNLVRLVALLGISALPATAFAQGIKVETNQAKIVKLARPASTVVIGNPKIADASVQDETTIVLTGKGFGVTNMVVLGADGEAIVDEQVIVSRQDKSSVRVFRRADVQTLSCTPRCEAAYKSSAESESEQEMLQSQ